MSKPVNLRGPEEFDRERRPNLRVTALAVLPSGLPVAGLVGSYHHSQLGLVVFGVLTGLSILANLMLLPMWSLEERVGLRRVARTFGLISLVASVIGAVVLHADVLAHPWIILVWPVLVALVLFIIIGHTQS